MLADVVGQPFWKERFQKATWWDHICGECGNVIAVGVVYRVTCWKRGRFFRWKKSCEIC